MAASVSVPSRSFNVGTYGPFSLSQIMGQGYTKLRVTITQTSPQASGDPAAKVILTTDADTGLAVPIRSPFQNRDGSLAATYWCSLNLPEQAAAASLSFEVYVPMTASVLLEAF